MIHMRSDGGVFWSTHYRLDLKFCPVELIISLNCIDINLKKIKRQENLVSYFDWCNLGNGSPLALDKSTSRSIKNIRIVSKVVCMGFDKAWDTYNLNHLRVLLHATQKRSCAGNVVSHRPDECGVLSHVKKAWKEETKKKHDHSSCHRHIDQQRMCSWMETKVVKVGRDDYKSHLCLGRSWPVPWSYVPIFARYSSTDCIY